MTVVGALNLWGAASVVIFSFGGKSWCSKLSLFFALFWLTVFVVILFGEEFRPAVAKLTQ